MSVASAPSGDTVRIAILVAYDGTGFHGFARQPGQRTVQGELEAALSRLLRADVLTTGAGRTDAGVHAHGQVVTFDVAGPVDPERLQDRLNRLLKPEIAARGVVAVPPSFDARFSATRREYEYRIVRGSAPDPFLDRYALHVPDALSIRAMRTGARALVGEHDFSSFCRRGQSGPLRRLRTIAISSRDDVLTVRVVGDSFCHQMVRSIVGLLLEVGRGKRPPEDVARVLAARDRAASAPVAPAKGLHLVAVGYRRDPFARVRR